MKDKITIFSFLLLFSSCVKDIGTGITPAEKDYEEFSTAVVGLSGLCFSKDSTSLMAVSDKFGIYELNFDGTTKRKIDYNGANDFEAIALKYKTGDYLLADETSMTVSTLNSDLTLTQITKVNVDGGISNKGIEGLTYGEDTLYICNQEAPAALIKFDLKSKTETGRQTLSFAGYLSDVCYDRSDKTLWICDSMQKKLYHCTLIGSVIAEQSINFVAKAEAVVIDRKKNIGWIGCDLTGILYKVKLKI